MNIGGFRLDRIEYKKRLVEILNTEEYQERVQILSEESIYPFQTKVILDCTNSDNPKKEVETLTELFREKFPELYTDIWNDDPQPIIIIVKKKPSKGLTKLIEMLLKRRRAN